MQAIIDTIEYFDEGKIIATRLKDEWFLFKSDIDGKLFYVNPSYVEFIKW